VGKEGTLQFVNEINEQKVELETSKILENRAYSIMTPKTCKTRTTILDNIHNKTLSSWYY